MRKFIFGCVLMLFGGICGTGWIIAGGTIVEGGAWSTVLNVLDDPEGVIAMVFYAIAVAGAVLAIRYLKDEEQK